MLDLLGLDPADAPAGRRADWLAERLRAAIADGTLTPGTALPPSRVLAAQLGFARGTVVEACQRLVAEAMLVAEPRRSLVVAETGGRPAGAAAGGAPRPERGVVDLAHGVPDVIAFPRASWLRAERDVLSNASAAQLGYPHPAGAPELRLALRDWLARSRGVVADPERIIVTGGVAGALSLLAQTLAGRGWSSLAIEDPANAGTRRLLEHWMHGTPAIPVDEQGIDVTALAASGAPAVLVTPAHQYPTGVVLAPERRRALVEWAQTADGLIVEDDYDAEHRYDRHPVRALQPLAPEHVASVSSLSKTLAPALRLGWLVPPASLHADLLELRAVTDLGPASLPQLVLALLLERGVIERHLRLVRTRHRQRRDALVTGIRTALPDARIGGVAAGLHLVVAVDDDVAIARRLAERGILVQALSPLYAGPAARSGLVVHYGSQPEHVLTAAAERIAEEIAR